MGQRLLPTNCGPRIGCARSHRRLLAHTERASQRHRLCPPFSHFACWPAALPESPIRRWLSARRATLAVGVPSSPPPPPCRPTSLSQSKLPTDSDASSSPRTSLITAVELINDAEHDSDDDLHDEVSPVYASTAVSETSPSSGGNVVVDGGSTGSKLFSFDSFGKGTPFVKVRTSCTVNRAKNTLTGLASFSYPVADCESTVSNPIMKKKNEGGMTVKNAKNLVETDGAARFSTPADHSPHDYANFLLGELQWVHEKRMVTDEKTGISSLPCPAGEVQDGACPAATNRKAIPIMATAGMRLLTKEQNDNVWTAVCGTKHSNGYSFPSRGANCGTIPGTREAYYEWLADQVTDVEDNMKAKGIFSKACLPIGKLV